MGKLTDAWERFQRDGNGVRHNTSNNNLWAYGDHPTKPDTPVAPVYRGSATHRVVWKPETMLDHGVNPPAEIPCSHFDITGMTSHGLHWWDDTSTPSGIATDGLYYCLDGCRGHVRMTEEKYMRHRRIIHHEV